MRVLLEGAVRTLPGHLLAPPPELRGGEGGSHGAGRRQELLLRLVPCLRRGIVRPARPGPERVLRHPEPREEVGGEAVRTGHGALPELVERTSRAVRGALRHELPAALRAGDGLEQGVEDVRPILQVRELRDVDPVVGATAAHLLRAALRPPGVVHGEAGAVGEVEGAPHPLGGDGDTGLREAVPHVVQGLDDALGVLPGLVGRNHHHDAHMLPGGGEPQVPGELQGGEAHLPGLEHDVPPGAPGLELRLDAVPRHRHRRPAVLRGDADEVLAEHPEGGGAAPHHLLPPEHEGAAANALQAGAVGTQRGGGRRGGRCGGHRGGGGGHFPSGRFTVPEVRATTSRWSSSRLPSSSPAGAVPGESRARSRSSIS